MEKKVKKKLEWLLENTHEVRLLEVLMIRGKTRITVYLETHKPLKIDMPSYDEAVAFVCQKAFYGANKEIHSL